MSRKSNLSPYHIINAGDMSATITSTPTNILWLDNVGIQLIFTGTPTGTFSVEVSNDYATENGTPIDSGTWTAISFGSAPTAGGAAGNIYLDINQLSAAYVRVVYSPTSGSGTLDAYITGKQV